MKTLLFQALMKKTFEFTLFAIVGDVIKYQVPVLNALHVGMHQ